jgi:hypothetical protein
MTNEMNDLYKNILTVLKYLPKVYAQKEYKNDFPGNIYIHYPYKDIPNNAIFFVLPMRGSVEYTGTTSNKLVIQYWQSGIDDNGKPTVNVTQEKVYDILIEKPDGSKRFATIGDILPDRLCMFRFVKSSSNYVVLCNDPLHGDVYCSSLKVTGEVNFNETPKVNQFNLVTSNDLATIEKKLTDLENKIQTGTQTAESYFKEHPNLPVGTIYIQTEE